MSAEVAVLLCVALAGLITVGQALAQARRVAPEFGDFLEGALPDPRATKLEEPLVPRLLEMVRRGVGRRVERLLPGPYLDNIEHQLTQAGLAGQRTPAEQIATQMGLTVVGAAVAFLLRPFEQSATTALAIFMLPVMGWMLPAARLKRAIRQRSDQIFKDLPDIIDMLAVAVEAGSGFEAALSIVCQHFRSPLADELALSLREMELGMPRKEALQDLKRRMDIDVVRTFVLAMVQADALGIPIGRVLKTQANEVRARRRAWAREKAAKLPVKILFPLVLFIFPPIMAIAMGPAAAGFSRLGGG
jgi:tight adherence protein C